MTTKRSPVVSRSLRIAGRVERGESISLDDCLFVSDLRSIGLWRVGRFLSLTKWQPLLSEEVAAELFQDIPSFEYQRAVSECVEPLALAAAGVDTPRATVLRGLRRVIAESLARDVVGHTRWLAETWRDIDPLGYAQFALQYGRDPHPGVPSESIESVRQRLVERLLASDLPDARLVGLRLLEDSSNDFVVE